MTDAAYTPSAAAAAGRADFATIAALVARGSRVLDLGCGDGSLLAYLKRDRGVSGYGIEIDDANVLACVQRGVNVIQLNLDEGLSMFEDASFDVVLQIDTLQNLRNAEVMLRETVRVGQLGIVAFPNFAHWPNRLSVLRGRMPVTKTLPYQWYDTLRRLSTSALTISRERAGEKRQSVVKLTIWNLHRARANAAVRSPPNARAGSK